MDAVNYSLWVQCTNGRGALYALRRVKTHPQHTSLSKNNVRWFCEALNFGS